MGEFHRLCSTCYSLWRPAVDGLLLSAWIVIPMAGCHNLAKPETMIDRSDRDKREELLRSKFDRSRRAYIKFVPRECAQSSVWGVCETKLQLLELLSHNGDEDAARGNQQVSRSRCSQRPCLFKLVECSQRNK
jgi:hypothetical protein